MEGVGFTLKKGPGISLGGSGTSWGESLGLFGVSEPLHLQVPKSLRTLKVGLRVADLKWPLLENTGGNNHLLFSVLHPTYHRIVKGSSRLETQ